jgi:hypothetical protein
VQYLLGAVRAMQHRDPDAITAWESALATGRAPAMTRQLLIEALLRRGEASNAASVMADVAPVPSSPSWTRLAAAVHIATGQTADAIALLDTHLGSGAPDPDAEWLRLHALYAEAIKGGNRDRFAREARQYIERRGPNAELVTEWLRIMNDK